ncbi:hypothetical protein ACHAPE_003851 [Trichoderma viride]
MQRFPAARLGARLMPRSHGISTQLSRRWLSDSQAPRSASSRPGVLVWGIGAAVAAGGGYFLLNGSTANKTKSVPLLSPVSSEDDISVVSPVPILDLKAVNQKLREQAQSFVFDGENGQKGRVDVVRVASNDPVEDEWSVAIGKGIHGGTALYAGVYDGHSGWQTSKVLKQALIPYVSTALSKISAPGSGDVIEAAIKRAFTSLDDRILGTARKAAEAGYEPGSTEVLSALAPALAGSCALLCVYDPKSSVLRTAVTGDSRAVLGSWSSESSSFAASALSKDQTGFNQDEVKRLDTEHPGEGEDMINPKTGRLMGIAITRGFGDHRWKWPNEFLNFLKSNYHGTEPRAKSKTPPYMIATPEVTTRHVQTSDFVILASDGLWDVMSNDDAVTCVSRWLSARRQGKPEAVKDVKTTGYTIDDDGWPSYKATPEHFAIEDLDNAAVCLVKNALGGTRRAMLCGSLTATTPISRYVRDDITVQVIFFKDP